MQALHEGGDERVARTETVDDLHRMAWDVDLCSFVEEQRAALSALEHDRGDAELEQRLSIAGGGLDFFLVADNDVGVARRGARELAVLVRLLPQRRPPV